MNNSDDRIVQLLKKQQEKATLKKKPLKKLNLSYKKIKSLPDYLFELDSVVILDLHDNDISTIQDDIVKLDKLEELDISDNKLSTLPASFCTLKRLKVLDISRNLMKRDNGYFVFPEQIGEMTGLNVLYSDYNKCLPLPESFSNLRGLETLWLFQCSDAQMVNFPEEITALSNLKVLNIGSNSFREIPEKISNLTKLEYLNLSSSLCFLKCFPDLSALQSLTILDASGSKSFSERPDPDPSIIGSFFNITSLKDLNISGFKHIDAKHFEGISKLKKLEVLDISDNKLERLPEELFSLSSLKILRAGCNNIAENDLQKLRDYIPEIQFEGL